MQSTINKIASAVGIGAPATTEPDFDVLAIFSDREMNRDPTVNHTGVIFLMLKDTATPQGRSRLQSAFDLLAAQVNEFLYEWPLEQLPSTNSKSVWVSPYGPPPPAEPVVPTTTTTGASSKKNSHIALGYCDLKYRRKMLRRSNFTLHPGKCVALGVLSDMCSISARETGDVPDKWIVAIYAIVEQLCMNADYVRYFHKVQSGALQNMDMRRAKHSNREAKPAATSTMDADGAKYSW